MNFYTSFATDQNNVWDNTLDPSILAFSKGNLAMFFGYSWDYFTIKQDNPKLSFKIVPVPQLPGQDVNMASYWAEGVSVKSKHQKEALLFMKYLAQKSTEENLYAEEAKERTFGEIYARTDLASTLVSNPVLSAFVQQAPFAFSSPFVDSTYDNGLNQELNTYLGNAINSILNGTSAERLLILYCKALSKSLKNMDSREKAILKTLLYSDLFEYPLTKDEIFNYLIGLKIAKNTFYPLLKNTTLPIASSAGFFFLSGKKDLVKKRREREKVSLRKIKKAEKISQKIASIPTVKLTAHKRQFGYEE